MNLVHGTECQYCEMPSEKSPCDDCREMFKRQTREPFTCSDDEPEEESEQVRLLRGWKIERDLRAFGGVERYCLLHDGEYLAERLERRPARLLVCAADMASLLSQVMEYLDERMDANFEGTGPNEAMRLYTDCDELLKKAGVL